MSYIKVDHKKMLGTADKIDTYIESFNLKMSSIHDSVISLNSEWKGKDYQQVKIKWDEICDKGSTSYNMLISLKNYAGSVREASKRYKDAQNRAISRANNLCR